MLVVKVKGSHFAHHSKEFLSIFQIEIRGPTGLKIGLYLMLSITLPTMALVLFPLL